LMYHKHLSVVKDYNSVVKDYNSSTHIFATIFVHPNLENNTLINAELY
jgi:hypothetical protein